MVKLKQLDQSLPVQYRTYYSQLINTPDGSRKECLVFAQVATTASSFLRSSIEHTQFTLDNAEIPLDDTGSGHEALKEMLDTMEEHSKTAKALREAVGQWMKEEQTRMDVMRADMESTVERQNAKRAKARQKAENGEDRRGYQETCTDKVLLDHRERASETEYLRGNW